MLQLQTANIAVRSQSPYFDNYICYIGAYMDCIELQSNNPNNMHRDQNVLAVLVSVAEEIYSAAGKVFNIF